MAMNNLLTLSLSIKAVKSISRVDKNKGGGGEEQKRSGFARKDKNMSGASMGLEKKAKSKKGIKDPNSTSKVQATTKKITRVDPNSTSKTTTSNSSRKKNASGKSAFTQSSARAKTTSGRVKQTGKAQQRSSEQPVSKPKTRVYKNNAQQTSTGSTYVKPKKNVSHMQSNIF